MRKNKVRLITVLFCLMLIPLLGVSAEQAKVGNISISFNNTSQEIIFNGSFLTFSLMDYKPTIAGFVHTQVVISDAFPYADPFADGKAIYNKSIVMGGTFVNITGKLHDGTSYVYINCTRPFNDSAVNAISYNEIVFSPLQA